MDLEHPASACPSPDLDQTFDLLEIGTTVPGPPDSVGVAGALAIVAHVEGFLGRVITVLDAYGEDTRASSRRFDWVLDKEWRDIVERDYAELTRLTFPAGAWKMTVVAAGSILEAILCERLARSPEDEEKARDGLTLVRRKKAEDRTPGDGAKVPRADRVNRWNLEDMIVVAARLGILPPDREKSIDAVLRDYRNFIHPTKERRAKHAPSEGFAQQAVGTLNTVCDHFERAAAEAARPPSPP